jgi:hypothetical protein
MEIVESEQGKTCGTCKHWIRLPGMTEDGRVNPHVRGDCRRLPPQFGIQMIGNRLAQSLAYPALPPNFPACGEHQTRLEE